MTQKEKPRMTGIIFEVEFPGALAKGKGLAQRVNIRIVEASFHGAIIAIASGLTATPDSSVSVSAGYS